jgi:hypothetical protein
MSAPAKPRVVFTLSCLLVLGCSSSKTSPKAVADSLVREIPLQSTPPQVLDYLNSHKVKHSQYIQDSVRGNLIEAAIPYDPTEWRVVYTSYGIEFRFDSNNHLIDKETHELYTGP